MDVSVDDLCSIRVDKFLCFPGTLGRIGGVVFLRVVNRMRSFVLTRTLSEPLLGPVSAPWCDLQSADETHRDWGLEMSC